jgi:hypothetical protein
VWSLMDFLPWKTHYLYQTSDHALISVAVTLRHISIFPLKVLPPARWRFIKPHLMNTHFVLAVIRSRSLHYIPSSRNIQLNLKIFKLPPHFFGNLTSHDWSVVNIPCQPPRVLVPSKPVCMALRMGNIVHVRVEDAMLVVVLPVILTPM